MKKRLTYTFDDHLRESLKDPEFKKIWQQTEVDYALAAALMKARSKRKISQRALAKKVKTTQKIISNIETMDANPSLNLLKRIAGALDAKLELKFKY